MARPLTGSRTPALSLAGLGAAALAVGLPGGALLVSAATAPWVSVVGAACLGAGIVWLVATWRRAPEELQVVPAHVAFMLRTPRPQDVPDEPERAPYVAMRPPNERAERLEGLDAQIRDLTRQINKAGVMLATGKLSQEGYAHYVDALKEKRGRLEASRVDLQLRN